MAVVNDVRKGILWTGLEKLLVLGLEFVQSVLLARLLLPRDFGLAAMLGVFLSIGGTLAEGGLSTALVVKGRHLARTVESAALRWNLLAALCLYVLLFAGSPLIAQFYGEPQLVPLTGAMALGLVINAASVVATARLTRWQSFGRLAWVNSASTILGSCVGIGCAWCGLGVWSIAALVIASALLRTLGMWWCARRQSEDHEVSDAASQVEFRPVLSLGLKFMASSLIWNVYCNLSNLIIGRLYSSTAVGLFARGQRWAQLPAEVVNSTVERVALPVLSARRSSVAALLALNCALVWLGLVVLWLGAKPIVGGVLGERWLDCVPYLRIMIVGVALMPVSNVILADIKAKGAGEALLWTELFKKPVGVLAIAVGAFYGIEGLAWAFVVGQLAEMVADVWVWKRLK